MKYLTTRPAPTGLLRSFAAMTLAVLVPACTVAAPGTGTSSGSNPGSTGSPGTTSGSNGTSSSSFCCEINGDAFDCPDQQALDRCGAFPSDPSRCRSRATSCSGSSGSRGSSGNTCGACNGVCMNGACIETPMCIALHRTCGGSAGFSCCSTSDGTQTIFPACDDQSGSCCVPRSEACTSDSQCCPGLGCVTSAGSTSKFCH